MEDSDITPELTAAVALAESLIKLYAERGGDVQAAFAGFVGLVYHRDPTIARDCLTAFDKYVEII